MPRAVRTRPPSRLEPRPVADLQALLPGPGLGSARPERAPRVARPRGGDRRAADRVHGPPGALGETSEEALDACGVPWEGLDPRGRARPLRDRRRRTCSCSSSRRQVSRYADRARRAFATVARNHGASIHEHSRVASRPDELDADVVVVCRRRAGQRSLLAPHGIDLPSSRRARPIVYFDLDRTVFRRSSTTARAPASRCIRCADPRHGLKVGRAPGRNARRSRRPERPDAGLVAETVDWRRPASPGLADPEPVGARHLPLHVDRRRVVHPRAARTGRRRLCLLGHGFKFAPAVGEQLARSAGD